MPPRVAILGWGSLLWEGSAFDRWHDDWRYDGPILKLEFSRVSASRLNALTLVIDRDNGQPNRVAWCLSRRDDPVLTHADLQSREGTTARNIGRILLAQLDLNPTDRSAADIAAWARTQALDAVVWTRLSSNFEAGDEGSVLNRERPSLSSELTVAGKNQGRGISIASPRVHQHGSAHSSTEGEMVSGTRPEKHRRRTRAAKESADC